MEAELARLGKLLPAKTFLEIDLLLSYFGIGQHRRRPILAIVGGTNFGKSFLGIQILKRVCALVRVPEYLEITVEGQDFLDFIFFEI